MTRALAWLGRHGRWVLVAGLVAGIAAPGLARAFSVAIVPMIGVLLFLAALRLGPLASVPPRAALGPALRAVLVLQVALPLVAALTLGALGLLERPAATGVVLVLAAAPITGAPGLALMCRADAVGALRQLALGTVLLPLTALPIFAVLPVFAGSAAVADGAARLLLLIAVAVVAAAFLRRVFPALRNPPAAPAIEGAIALTMGLVVIGLMSAVGPALLAFDGRLALTLALVFALQLGLSTGTWSLARRTRTAPEAAGLAIAAGNRNLALFLAALPPDAVTAMLLFVGCYQVPMYLTPLTLPRLPGWPRA